MTRDEKEMKGREGKEGGQRKKGGKRMKFRGKGEIATLALGAIDAPEEEDSAHAQITLLSGTLKTRNWTTRDLKTRRQIKQRCQSNLLSW